MKNVYFFCSSLWFTEIEATSLAIVFLQMLAYYVSLGKGIDDDKTKNLAKIVTVELDSILNR